MLNYYPIVKYPHLVSRYLNDEIPELDKEIEPAMPKFQQSNYWLLIVSLFAIIVAFYLLYSLFTLKKLLYCSFIIYVGGFVLRGTLYDLKKIKKNNILIKEKHETLLKEYNERQSIKSDLNRQLYDKIVREKYKREKISEICRSANRGYFNYTQVTKKGATEDYFLCVLFAYFGDKIKTGYTINMSNLLIFTQYEYMPDFCFVDEDISIDIEIDEPYTLEGKIPIHLLNDSKETNRDSFFTSQNWVVIRFSENQIIENPFGCVKFISQVIKKITGKEKNIINFNNITNSSIPNKVSKWTVEEVGKLIRLNYRENMLAKINQDYLPRFINLFKNKFVVIDIKLYSFELATNVRSIKYLKPLFLPNNTKILYLESDDPYKIGEWVEFSQYTIIEKVIDYLDEDIGKFKYIEHWLIRE